MNGELWIITYRERSYDMDPEDDFDVHRKAFRAKEAAFREMRKLAESMSGELLDDGDTEKKVTLEEGTDSVSVIEEVPWGTNSYEYRLRRCVTEDSGPQEVER